MFILINWVRVGFKAWAGWFSPRQLHLLWAISLANYSPFIIFSISYFLWSAWMFRHTLLSKRSRNWWKRMSGWTSPSEQCSQSRHWALTWLSSPLLVHKGETGTFWQVCDVACDVCDVFSCLLPGERIPNDTSPSSNTGRLRQPKLDVSWSSLPFLSTRGDFPSVLSNWLKRCFRNFFSLSIVLIKNSLPP